MDSHKCASSLAKCPSDLYGILSSTLRWDKTIRSMTCEDDVYVNILLQYFT